MKWRILNPAEGEEETEHWGDTHYCRALARSLRRLGHETQIDSFNHWRNECASDLSLVIRGRNRCMVPIGGVKLLWIISHPAEVTIEECNDFDWILVASREHAAQLREKTDRPVTTLFQAVDSERFRPPEHDELKARRDLIFVGNTRSTARESVLWAVASGFPLKVWGRGWAKWIDARFTMSEYLDNDLLPALYAGAKATLNDHWPDMRRLGYVNNRVFEALACGLPVVSDYQPALFDLFGDAVLQYATRKQFLNCMDQLYLDYPRVLARVEKVISLIPEQHSFEIRARELCRVVSKLKEEHPSRF